ncbi:inositol monophosphatase family protein [Rhodococcus sp. NPDC019627]|uniref:inositol monophosphatase family protein n=1 Tax=unclassified Rhodococcus (in: high G+C Gram-positive bacteria) TaxID=192944 RepID=UPI0033DD0119
MHAPQSRDTVRGHTAPDPQHLREVAVAVAQEAAAHVRARRPEVFGIVGSRLGSGESVASKSSPTDPVTVVDTEAELVIRERLAQWRPDDAILGEEGGGEGDSLDGVRWVVDPIDGTVNFLYGVPAYAVSVAAQIDGVSVAGAVVDVAAQSTYSAASGRGATMTDVDGRVSELRCNPVRELSMTLLATGFGYGAGRRAVQGALIGDILPRVRDIRRIGSAALDLCMVAAGRVDAHFEHGLSPWDWAAGSLIAAEAGARVRVPSPHTSSADGEITVAAAPGIADALDALFAEVGCDRPIPE